MASSQRRIKAIKHHPTGRWRSHTSIDPKRVYELAAIHCTVEEIAASVGIAPNTLTAHFRQDIDRGIADGNIAIRKAQYDLAMAGSPSMLIHLGKHWLAQREEIVVQDKHRGDIAQLLEGLRREWGEDAETSA